MKHSVVTTVLRLLAACFALYSFAHAAVFNVTTAVDEFDSPSGSSLSLREAVRDATSSTGADTITYDASLNGQTITLGTEVVLGGDVTIDATSLPAGITISGGNATRIFSIPADQTVTLNRLTLTQGNGTGMTNSGSGGAVFNESSSLSLNHCSFQGNSASGGGAIINFRTSLILNNCSFQGNSASSSGGAISNYGGTSLNLNNCSFRGNGANEGGAIYNNSSSMTLNNCSFQGNGGGALSNYFSSSLTLNNCSFQGNGGVTISNLDSSPQLNNCIIWNNSSSVSNAGFFVGSFPSYSHCLIQGLDPGGLSNLVGTNPANNPLFVLEVDPASAPTTTSGDLRLRAGSPALDVGNNAANATTIDLAGNPRIQNAIIDLGAYEGAFTTFALLHPGLDPTGDANGNGISNFGDYAAGGNPAAPDDPTLRPKLNGNQLTFSFRNAADVTKEFQKSTTLLPGSWMLMIENTDYTVSSTNSFGDRILQTLSLESALLTNNRMLFFRETFQWVP